jgi:glucuronoarabinoxylan endo-1,4-beta-xylanase
MKIYIVLIASLLFSLSLCSQTVDAVVLDPTSRFQKFEGFGGAIAWYGNWLKAHPNKEEIYEALFKELDLDILRIRNAHDYDSEMVQIMSQILQEIEVATGKKPKILSTSWGPPASLKSNNNSNNGGTLKYTVENSTVKFDYTGFTDWWKASLDEYNANGIYPTYISLQNEPDYTAGWVSCRLDPTEKITSTDTIAGYNKALEKIYDMIQNRTEKPKILGPEVIGIGYNKLQNYMNNLDASLLYGVAHHLYTGVDSTDPWGSTNFKKAGETTPEIPHFQTEYAHGGWFAMAGLLYKSLNDENVASYLYWDLVWSNNGMIDMENPWNPDSWTTTKGYTISKDFYTFKQFSAFIKPAWERVAVSIANENIKSVAFISPTEDSASIVLINRSATNSYTTDISIPGYQINAAFAYRTSELEDCISVGALSNSEIILPPHSITTVKIDLSPTVCVKPGVTNGTPSSSAVGISSIKPKSENWPNNIHNGYLVLESNKKGMVITRMANPETTIGTNAVKGMIVYDTDDKCIKMYNGLIWGCVVQSCPD